MNADSQTYWFLRSTNFIRHELRKATQLPAKQMIPRVRELLQRQEALSREVATFLKQKDTQ
jgi:hypothetical protein